MMSVLAIVLLACGNRYCQSVFFRGQWTGCIRSHRAGRTVSAIEVQDYLSIHHRVRVKEPATRIRLRLAGEIADHETQPLLGVAFMRGKRKLVTIEFEVNLADNRSGSDVAQHVGDVHGSLSIGRNERSTHAIILV